MKKLTQFTNILVIRGVKKMENNELPKIPEWVNERMRTFNIGESIKYECLANIDTRIHDGNICLGESRAKETAKNIRLRQKIDLYVDRKCNQESDGRYYVTIMRINTPQYSDIPDRVKALSIGESFSYKCTGNKDGKWEDGDVWFDEYLNRMVHKHQKQNPTVNVCGNLNRIKSLRNNWRKRKGLGHISIVSFCAGHKNGEFYTTVGRIEDLPESLQNVKVSDKANTKKLKSYTAHKTKAWEKRISYLDEINSALNPEGKLEFKNLIDIFITEYQRVDRNHTRLRNTKSTQYGRQPRKKLRAEILNRDNRTCHYCNKHEKQLRSMRRMVTDHVIPWRVLKENNILDHEELNLVTACDDCNYRKSDNILKNHCHFCFDSYTYYKNIIGEDNLMPFVREESNLERIA